MLIFLRVFANETSQFLAPYEASVKSRSNSGSPPTGSEDGEPPTGEQQQPQAQPPQRYTLGVSASHVRSFSIFLNYHFNHEIYI